MGIGFSPGGSFTATGANLVSLIMQAYDVRGFQVADGVGWMNDDKYTIVTKDESPGLGQGELQNMNDEQRTAFRERMESKLRAMLADRFQLRVHKETREMSVFALTVAKGGPRMKAAADDGHSDSGINAAPADEGKVGLKGKGVPMAVMTRFLSDQVQRTVLDRTGLTAKYDFTLVYSPGMGDATGPSIFTALQEQLGLKLDSQKAPVEVVVIDAAQKPSEN